MSPLNATQGKLKKRYCGRGGKCPKKKTPNTEEESKGSREVNDLRTTWPSLKKKYERLPSRRGVSLRDWRERKNKGKGGITRQGDEELLLGAKKSSEKSHLPNLACKTPSRKK